MNDVTTVLEIIKKQFSSIQDLGKGLFRCERSYSGKVFATVYFDISDDVVKRANNLHDFQEGLLGADFFKVNVDRRWNNYLYFWAGPKSKKDSKFSEAKSSIEKDRHFARKFVLSADELSGHLCSISSQTSQPHISEDASVRWGELLTSASLGIILEKRPRTRVIELISSGEAFVLDNSPVDKSALNFDQDPLGTGFLHHLQINGFRPAINDSKFSFSNVNLIFGQNGAGKTSLLESIEGLYCGRIRRDSDANISGIQGCLEMPNGSLVNVKTTTIASVIKERNLSWYGRSNQLSSAITNSFTRFNFLDTDAAFRLASDNNAEDIKEDLSLLLVGPEASSLWTYIKKINSDIADKYSEACKQIPFLLKETDYLGRELKRLQESPSESATLIKTYQAGLQAIGIKWDLVEKSTSINLSERTDLEYLLRGFRSAISVVQSTSVTKRLLQDHKILVMETINTLNDSVKEFNAIRKKTIDTEALMSKYKSDLHLLRSWMTYCENGAPIVHESIAQKTKALSVVRKTIGDIFIDDVYELSEKYELHSISDALQAATDNLKRATQEEASFINSLEQIEGLEESVDALRSDLRSAVISIIDRTGDPNHCPVCMTFHKENELLQKIEKLTLAEVSSTTETLRQSVKSAKMYAQQERNEIKSLEALKRFADTNMLSSKLVVGDIQELLLSKYHDISVLNEELSSLESKFESLSLLGIDWSKYDEIRHAATIVLGKNGHVSSLEDANKHILLLNKNIEITFKELSNLRLNLKEITEKSLHGSAPIIVPNDLSITPIGLLSNVKEIADNLESSINFLQAAEQQIDLDSKDSFEEIILSLEQILNDFDRAYYAFQNEVVAKTELVKKMEELSKSTEQLYKYSLNRDNLEKAKVLLDHIIQDYSLEKATQKSLESIRTHVSSIFSRVHAPIEYTLGDFQSETLLVSRSGTNHGINQVSTGQRAAFALSIFLALNLSAESAPPIILIDDPIAHIDDLNALSFIDYLRDLAIETNKQIFFATADSKLAALFEKKFEFLGDRYKKIVLTK